MATAPMSSVDKALALLSYFSVQSQELGLSEMARLSGHDKTTVLRCMNALMRNGFVEQDSQSRKYRLGLAPIKLAQIRESSFPIEAILKRHLNTLAHGINETAHATLLIAGVPTTAAISEPDTALRVHLDASEIMPIHATASGMAIAAYLPRETQQHMLTARPLHAFTEHTQTQPDHIEALFAKIRADGISHGEQSYERGVSGSAVPIFGADAQPIGAIAIAAVSSRLTRELQQQIDTELRLTAALITRELGGTRPSHASQIKEAAE